MPDTYAHYRFGREVLAALPKEEQTVINVNRRLFDIGLHGPDPLFYYFPLSHHRLHALGSEMHRLSGLDFFRTAGSTFCSRREPWPDRAYLYGFLCHFVLDSACHGYIDRVCEEGVVSHEEIEISFDRLLLVMDGKDPLRTDRAESLRMSAAEADRCAAVMARYFPGVCAGRLSLAVRQAAFFNRILRLPDPAVRRAAEEGMRLIGKYEPFHGHIVPAQPDSRCSQTDAQLLEFYGAALPEAVGLIRGFTACARGQAPWPDRYRVNFGSEPA